MNTFLTMLAVAVALVGCSPSHNAGPRETMTSGTPPRSASNEPIGTATMKADGTIVLDLRAEDPSGRAMGDARVVYPRGHREYAKILDHLGGLKPGESKPVPPWPDN